MNYYNLNASKFIESTINLDMSSLYDQFTKHLKPGAKILDLGCGPGRDVKSFNNMGYNCIGMEPSLELRSFAETYTGKLILPGTAQSLNFQNEFDGIWACASLLHVDKEELSVVLQKMTTALKSPGFIYLSFKHGTSSGVRADGRFFQDMNSDLLRSLLTNVTNLNINQEWITVDIRVDNSTDWFNVILIKNP